MAVTARRARRKKAPAPEIVDEELEEEEEDEEDWEAGGDDDDELEGFENEEDDDDDDEGNVAGILEGQLSYRDNTLHFKGETFWLQSTSTSSTSKLWNPLQDPPPKKSMPAFQMKGTLTVCDQKDCQKETNEKLFDVTWNIREAAAAGKSTGDDGADDDDEDGKQRTSLFYEVIGKEVSTDKNANLLIQWKGGFHPSTTNTHTGEVPLHCQLEYIIPETRHSVAAAAAPIVAVAAAAAAADEEDDDDEDADEAMNYDELIALHEDANVNVEELKRRYQGDNNNRDDEEEEEEDKPAAKKLKSAPKEEDEDDDDVGF